jgi:hypothetical protein
MYAAHDHSLAEQLLWLVCSAHSQLLCLRVNDDQAGQALAAVLF